MKHPQLARAFHGGADGSSFAGLDFSVNTNPFGANPILIAAARAADLEHYPDPTYSSLKHSLAAFHDLSPENVVLAVGASELLHRITRAFVTSNSSAVSILPAFGEFERAVRLERGNLITTVPEKTMTVLEQVKPKLIYASRPNNPLGRSLEINLLLEVADWCKLHGSILLLDQAYAPFAPNLTRMPDHESVIRLESPGKVHGLVGLRLAYALAPVGLTSVLENLAPAWVLPASTAAALEALPTAQDFVLETVPKILDLADDLAGQLSSITTAHHLGTPFFTLEVGSAPSVSKRLFERGVRVRDCSSFGFPTRIRVSAKLESANAILVQSLKEILHG